MNSQQMGLLVNHYLLTAHNNGFLLRLKVFVQLEDVFFFLLANTGFLVFADAFFEEIGLALK